MLPVPTCDETQSTHPELSAQSSVRERFLREGYVANSVEHTGAVEEFDDDVTDSREAYLVMELLAGETLEARCERKGRKLAPLEVVDGRTDLPPIASVDSTLDPELAAFVDRALSYEKSERFPEAAAMQQELRRIYHAAQDGARSLPRRPPQLSRVDTPLLGRKAAPRSMLALTLAGAGTA